MTSKKKKSDKIYINEYSPEWKEALQKLDPTPEQLNEVNMRMNCDYDLALELIRRAEEEADLLVSQVCWEYKMKIAFQFAHVAKMQPEMETRADQYQDWKDAWLLDTKYSLLQLLEKLHKAEVLYAHKHRYGFFANSSRVCPIDTFGYETSITEHWAVAIKTFIQYKLLNELDHVMFDRMVEIGSNLNQLKSLG
jgi:hypothetical protein